MTWNNETVWCDGCGVEVTWGPVVVGERIYCCQDCAQGIPCECGALMEMDDERRDLGETSAAVTGNMA
jgi:hypothetical protein